MSKATEDVLSLLHGKVAETMIDALDQADRAAGLLIKHGDDLPNDVIRFLEESREVNPSLLTSATKFLKDNNISCDPADDEQLSELEERLKQKRNNVTSIPLAD